MRKLEEELERDWPKPAVLPLPEAFAQIEQTPEFLSCHSEASIKIWHSACSATIELLNPTQA